MNAPGSLETKEGRGRDNPAPEIHHTGTHEMMQLPRVGEEVTFNRQPEGAPKYLAGKTGKIVKVNILDKAKPDLSLDDIEVRFGNETWNASLGEYQATLG